MKVLSPTHKHCYVYVCVCVLVLVLVIALITGQPEALLDKALDPSFRLWDAYGVLPVLCDPKRRGDTDACCVRYDHVQDIIRQTKEK